MKSGTTALSRYLSQHPQVFVAPKELHFFNQDDRFAKGAKWYERQFKQATAEHLAVGEKTPTYSYQPNVPARIQALIPNAKLIWILREPAARAYSNYWHAVKSGVEPLSFARAIAVEDQRVQQNLFKGYLRRSVYAEQVKRYLNYFPLEQMKFLLFEDLIHQPQATLQSAFEFLNVAHFEIDRLPKSANATYIPKSIYLEWLSKKLLGKTAYSFIHQVNRRQTEGYPPLSPALQQQLQQHFEPHNAELTALTGLTLGPWQGSRSQPFTNA